MLERRIAHKDTPTIKPIPKCDRKAGVTANNADEPAMSERIIAEIRLRHADFAARYSPGPDWEPFTQTHQDRGFLLERIATLERELEEAKAHPDCLRCLDLERDRDADRIKINMLAEALAVASDEVAADRAAIRAFKRGHDTDHENARPCRCYICAGHAAAIARATQEPGATQQ